MNDQTRMTDDGKVAAAAAGGAGPRPATFVIPLFVWVAAGFLFLALLWTGMFIASRQADTRTVPLATQGGRP